MRDFKIFSIRFWSMMSFIIVIFNLISILIGCSIRCYFNFDAIISICSIISSSLCSTLFILYVNDLLLSLPDNTALAHAVNMTLLASGPTASDAKISLQWLLQTVHQWSVVNSLHLNAGKCCYVYISLSK